MRAAIIAFFAVVLVDAASAADERPIGNNCNLTAAPQSAGEEINHDTVLRVFPRAKEIGPSYSGCQALFAPHGGGWEVVSLTEVTQGDPVRVWSPHERDVAVLACRFKRGEVVAGDPQKCPSPNSILLRSLAPGCADIIRKKVATHGLGAARPFECEYQ